MERKFYLIVAGIINLMWMGNVMALELLSPAFKQGDKIPQQYTCDGKNISPPLYWKDVPAGTQSFILIMDDPDAPAGTWDHWIILNIPANITSLNEDLQSLPAGSFGGKNSWSKSNYGGPCPPDREHRYFFKLYAIDTILPIIEGMTKQQAESAIKGHVLASTELVAKYQRPK